MTNENNIKIIKKLEHEVTKSIVYERTVYLEISPRDSTCTCCGKIIPEKEKRIRAVEYVKPWTYVNYYHDKKKCYGSAKC